MKKEEEAAKHYLDSLALGPILYEPRGNVPPDFTINGQIGVEVRRLNLNWTAEGETRGLEERRIPLFQQLRQLGAGHGPPQRGRSWYFSVLFWRPLPDWNEIAPAIRSAFRIVSSGGPQRDLTICKNLRLSFFPREELHKQEFVFAGGCDRDSTTFVIPALRENIKHCISEKTRKCAKFWAAYPEWWLILVDHIDFAQTADLTIEIGPWQRVILINPHKPTQSITFP